MTDLGVEHPALYPHAMRVLAHLDAAERSLVPRGDVQHFLKNQIGQRSVLLGQNLRSALILEGQNYHAAALALLRVAVEHHVFDRLLFAADRSERKISGVSEDTWARWQAQKTAREPGTEDILDMEWRSGTVRIVRSGIHSKPASTNDVPYTVSPYFHEYTNHDPFLGPRTEQAYLAGHFTSLDMREDFAEQNEAMRWGRLGWDSLRNNLQLNGLVSDEWLRRIQVHYRFLGAYVHPSSERAEQLLYGHNHPTNIGEDDHYISELVLLYVVSLACAELRAFIDFANRPPEVDVSSLSKMREDIDLAEEVSEYFWFPNGNPHVYDRVEEANHRGVLFEDGEPKMVAREGREPESIPLDEIPYFANPLRRLTEMHRSWSELTGFSYNSPLGCADGKRGR